MGDNLDADKTAFGPNSGLFMSYFPRHVLAAPEHQAEIPALCNVVFILPASHKIPCLPRL
jgi:hypothetical protein